MHMQLLALYGTLAYYRTPGRGGRAGRAAARHHCISVSSVASLRGGAGGGGAPPPEREARVGLGLVAMGISSCVWHGGRGNERPRHQDSAHVTSR